MQFINIFPEEDSIKYSQPMEMYLAHILNNEEVCKAIKDKESFKILDNGCYELNSSVDFGDLCFKAEAIGADEIILPDIMFDSERTVNLVIQSLNTLHRIYGAKIPYRLMAVVQGADAEEYADCARVYDKFPEITTIGIPKKFLRNNGDENSSAIKALDRGNFAHYLKDNYPTKQIHLLGLSWGIMELPSAIPYVRSVDTNFLVEVSKNGHSIWSTWDTIGESYSLTKNLTDDDWHQFEMNKKAVEEYLNGWND